MLHRIIVIGTADNISKLFRQLEQLPNVTSPYKDMPASLSVFGFRELTLKTDGHTYSFQHCKALPGNLSADLCVACDTDNKTQDTLEIVAKKSIPFIPHIVNDMSIKDLIDELKNRCELLPNETIVIPTEAIQLKKTLGQKVAASVTHGATLFAARIEVAKAVKPPTPDVHETISNAQL